MKLIWPTNTEGGDMLRGMVTVATDAVNVYNNLPGAVQSTVTAFAGLTGVGALGVGGLAVAGVGDGRVEGDGGAPVTAQAVGGDSGSGREPGREQPQPDAHRRARHGPSRSAGELG